MDQGAKPSGGDVDFGATLKRARNDARLSLAQLASATFVSRGWINNVEAGRRWPPRSWVRKVEDECKAVGDLVPKWDEVQAGRDAASRVHGLLSQSLKSSRIALIAQVYDSDLDSIQQSIANLAVEYLSAPPGPMLGRAIVIQEDLHRKLARGSIRKSELADAQVALSRISGVLAYAALDLGHADSAAAYSHISFRMASRAQDSAMQAWARGTQSLISRFRKDYDRAEWYISDGMKYAGAGTSEVRLLCGAAQCAANLGAVDGAVTFLDLAASARGHVQSDDEIEGLFGFSPAKQSYYSASSLKWLPDRRALEISARSAEEAIEIWSREPVHHRSLDDESLAHVYLATARIQMGQIDAAVDAVEPVLNLPSERRISWIRKSVGELAVLLDGDRYRKSVIAASARDRLVGYAVSALP